MSFVGAGPSVREGCVFCLPADLSDEAIRERHVIRHTPTAFALLNRYPYSNGHVLVCPTEHVSDPSALSPQAWTELNDLLRRTVEVVRRALGAHGVNVGLNLGAAAGAGVPGHLHWHVVPRWEGDTNYMAVTADVKVLPQALEDTWRILVDAFAADPE